MIAPIVRASVLAVGLAGLLLGTARAAEQDTTNGVAPVGETAAPAAAPAKAPATAATAIPAAPAPVAAAGSDAKRYCDSIAAVAAEARFAWQTRKLTELQTQVTQRVAELEKRQAELQATLARRDEAMKQAHDALITIYAKMQPDAAAAQIALLEDTVAAAILAQLSPRQSSAILNEVRPERASQLVAAMTSLPKVADKTDGKKS